MKTTSLIIFSILLLTSCKSLKMVKLMTKGEIEQQQFISEIPFEYGMGLIIIKVTIEGKEYDFLYDTGAPNVISTELAQELNIKPYVTNKTVDSQGKKEELEYLLLPSVRIGSVDFINTGAAVADLNRSSVIACLNIDGIIGANLMQKAIWQIDYTNKVIRISNSMDSLNVKNGKHIKFDQKMTGTPVADINVNGTVVKNVTIDSGSNGGFSLSEKTYRIAKDSASPVVIGIGTTTSGLYGVGEVDTNYYTTISTVSIGEIQLSNQMVGFNKGHALTLGNEFFENYLVTYNWFDKEMILSEKMEHDNSSFNSFGFSYFFNETKLLVSMLIEGSEADQKGIKRGDQIIAINGVDYSEMTQEKWCEILHTPELRKGNKIDVTLLMNGEKTSFEFKKNNQLIHD
jgi:hypothetical protein